MRLGAQLVLHGRIEGAEVERPAERQRGGFMARDDKGQQVVAQLVCVHPFFGLGVFAGQQQVEQVGNRFGAAGLPLADGAVGNGFHVLERVRAEHPAGARHPGRDADDVKQRNPPDLRDIGVDRLVHDLAVHGPGAGKGDVADHVEGGADHFLIQVGASGAGGEAVAGGIRRRRHDRHEVRDVAVRENGRRRAPLPAPVRALCDEQAVADGRPEQVLGDVGFGIVVQLFLEDTAQAVGVHHHVPADDRGLARYDGLARRDFGNDLQQVAPRRHERPEYAPDLGDQRHFRRIAVRLGDVGRCGHLISGLRLWCGLVLP